MREGWEIKKLGEVCEVITKGTTPTSLGFKFTDLGVNFIKVESLTESGKIIPNKVAYISEECHQSLKRSQLKENDILFSIAGALGRIGIVNKEIVPANTNQALAIVRLAKNSGISVSFLAKYFTSNIISEEIEKLKGGAAQQNLSLGQLNNLSIPFPSFPEQQRIVAILDEAFAAIAKAKANAELNLKNAKELFESYLQGVFESKGEDWEEKTLGDVLVKTETIDPTKKPNKEFIYLDVSSVNKETKEIENATVLLGKDAPSRARKLVRTNDVIFATVRPTHSRVALITEEYDEQVCSTGYIILRAKEFLNNNLVYYFLLTYSFNKQMDKLQKGASYPAVTDSEVKGIYIYFPKSLKKQDAIVQKLEALSAETKKLEAIYQQKINDLEELKKSVLQKAFSGELKTDKLCV